MPSAPPRIVTEISTASAPTHNVRWLLFLVSLPLLGGMGAFAISSNTAVERVETTPLITELALPTLATTSTKDDLYWHDERLQSGEGMPALLNRLGVSDPRALNFLKQQTELRALQKLKNGRTIRAITTGDGSLLSLEYLESDGKLVRIQSTDTGFTLTKEEAELTLSTTIKTGVIKTSLFAATDAVDLPDSVGTDLSEMFAGQINFHRGLRKGDRFKVIYETYSWKGQPVKTGRLLAAEFKNGTKVFRAMSFTDETGHSEYYTPEGQNLRRAFLQSPLPFSRITSGFSMRLHPILGTWKQHTGVDYGAPIGTPVKATAEGTITFVGTKGGYGNAVEIAHFNKFSTLYGHLSAFAKNLHVGQKVSQGEVIALVGQTGWATGPHLHYEFKIAGVQHDPLSDEMPVAKPLDMRYQARFKDEAGDYLNKFDLLAGGNQISLD